MGYQKSLENCFRVLEVYEAEMYWSSGIARLAWLGT